MIEYINQLFVTNKVSRLSLLLEVEKLKEIQEEGDTTYTKELGLIGTDRENMEYKVESITKP